MNPERDKFLLEEYKSLRKEIEFYVKEFRSQERYALVGIFALCSWMSAHKPEFHQIWFLPFSLAALITLRTVAMYVHTLSMGKYIGKTEKHFSADGRHVGGSEAHPSKLGGWENAKESRIVGFTTAGFLICLLVGTLVFGLVYLK